MEAGLKGGQKQATTDGGYGRTGEHSPFYRQVYEDTGRKPTKAAWQAEAVRQLRNGNDEESLNYQNLTRHADAEKELNAYKLADKQSGYNKVKVRNAPAGVKVGIPSFVKEKIRSPEYVAKNRSGELLQRIRDELPGVRAQVQALDKQIKGLSKKGDLKGITALNSENAAARLRLRALEGMERTQSGEYGRLANALDEKYPDVALKLKGKQNKTTVSGALVRGIDRPVETRPEAGLQAQIEAAHNAGDTELENKLTAQLSDQAMNPNASMSADRRAELMAKMRQPAAAAEPYNLEEVLGHPLNHEAYTGPNLNEGAFSPEDIKNLMSHNGQYADETGSSYSPNFDMTLPEAPVEPAARNIAGDTAAFNVLHEGGTVDDAVKAYKEATGATPEEAASAVNKVAETGTDMGSNEDVLKRNPQYGKVPDFETPTVADVSDKASSYRATSDLLQSRLTKAAKGMSEHDVTLLDQLRGHPIDEISQKAENPAQFSEVAQAAKDISDYNHEIRRQNGDITIYRQNYGAGMHYSDVTPDEKEAVSGYKDNLASTPGFSRERIIGDYGKAAQDYNLTRKNANFLEDVAHDSRQTLNYVRERATYRGLQEAKGDGAVHYGNPTFEQPVQLNGTKDVFATRDVADEWNKLHRQKLTKSGATRIADKGYKAASSLVVQATAVNPLIHGGNLETQAFIAAGKMGGEGTAGFLKAQAMATSEERAAARLGRLQHGDHLPSYGSGEDGFISRVTHGVTDINKNTMARIDNHIRDDLYMTYTDLGMDGREAVKTMNKFLGDGRAIGEATQNLGFFVKFAKTMIKALAETPKSKGTLLNAAIAAGVVWSVNKAFQEWTGNKHAHIHVPGELGIAKDVVTSAEDVAHKHYGQAGSTVTNRINPIVKEGAQQLFNKDLFTGKSLDESGGRGSHALGSLFPEAQSAGKVNSGSKSAAEAAGNFLGIYTPHAKGAPAAPNAEGTPLNFLNTAKAKAPTTGDKTGIDQQNAYFSTLESARNTLSTARKKVYDQITAGETDANGQPIGMNDKQAQAHYAELASNPDILAAVTKQKQDYAKATGLPLDPLYSPNITDAQRQEYLHMQSLPYKGDDYIQQEGANKGWLPQLTQDRVAYFATQDYSAAPPSQRVTPPQFDSATQADLTQATNLGGAEKVQFIQSHPDVQAAYDQIAQYTNTKRTAEGNAPFKLFPHADPDTQAALNNYLALPTGDGKNGGNAVRAAWIKANPDAYAKIQSYFTAESEWELANSAGQDRFQGATPSQQELKSAYGLGQYDIAKVKNADGTTTYSLDPAAAYAQKSAANSKATAGYKASNQRREATNAVKYAGRSKRVVIRTRAQNKRRLSRLNTAKVRVAKATPGKLRITSVPVA